VWQNLFALGRLLGFVLFHHQVLPLALSPVLFAFMTGETLTSAHVRALEPDGRLPGALEFALQPDGLAVLQSNKRMVDQELTFVSEELLEEGSQRLIAPVVPLKPGGEHTLVTEENFQEYQQLLAEHYLVGHCRQEIQVFLNGFWQVAPLRALQDTSVDARDLELILCGVPDIDMVAWKTHSQFPNNATTRWFWEILEEDFGPDNRARILAFSTGTSRVPAAGGFSALQPPFSITMAAANDDTLPQSHTCANNLVMPVYSSRAVVHQRLLICCEHGFGFGFA